MRKKEKYYLVVFRIYQYNSGRADNGSFDVRLKYKTLKEAIETKKKIDMVYEADNWVSYNEDLSEELREWVENLIADHTVSGGFINSEAKVIAKYDVDIEVNII